MQAGALEDAPARIRLLVGLGNPGSRYAGTRHNAGEEVVGRVAGRLGAVRWTHRYGARLAETRGPAGPLTILIPETFMNLSGDAVGPAAGAARIAPEEILVVHDEIDLPFGTVRGKVGGGTGGHNGLRSLRSGLGSAEFSRIRIGVGRPPEDWGGDGASWVLARHTEDADAVDRLLDRGAAMAESALADGMDEAIARFHARSPNARRSPSAEEAG